MLKFDEEENLIAFIFPVVAIGLSIYPITPFLLLGLCTFLWSLVLPIIIWRAHIRWEKRSN